MRQSHGNHEESRGTRIFPVTLHVNGQPIEVLAEFREREDGRWENVAPIHFPPAEVEAVAFPDCCEERKP